MSPLSRREESHLLSGGVKGGRFRICILVESRAGTDDDEDGEEDAEEDKEGSIRRTTCVLAMGLPIARVLVASGLVSPVLPAMLAKCPPASFAS